MTKHLTPLGENWQDNIAKARTHLEAVRTQLVEAEAELAERLARINRFEFNLRSKIGHLVSRLELLDKEIEALKQALRQRDEDWGNGNGRTTHWRLSDFEATQAGEYRYRQTAPPPPPSPIDQDTKTEIKILYRELARRFHPDMAVDETDRAYRTQMMMAINAAYTARDLAKLQALALEPDAAHLIDSAQSDAQLHAAIIQEIARCQRRLAEIESELAQLVRHRSSQLMQQQAQAEAENRKFWVEMAAQLRDQIAQRQVRRDVLKDELESVPETAVSLYDEAAADAVRDFNLEHAFDIDPDVEDIVFRRNNPPTYDEDNPEDGW